MRTKHFLAAMMLCMACVAAMAQSKAQYQTKDSVTITKLVNEGKQYLKNKKKTDAHITLFFARKLLNLPYVAHTLDKNKKEQLVVNIREMDCTTLVENVLALSMASMKQNARTGYASPFGDFIYYLRLLRYENGKVDYTTRNHYFTGWIENSVKSNLTTDVTSGQKAREIVTRQKVTVDYMSNHPSAYAMLKAHPEWLPKIRKMEQHLSSLSCPYIPKSKVGNNDRLREVVKDGDVLAIVTDKQGLDIAHLGFAVWKNDGLHMLHASSLKKRVIEDGITLRKYLENHKSHLGIRVIRMV